MPTYRYRCPADGDFDVWQKIHDHALTACPHCNAGIVKVMVPPNISAAALPNRGRAVVAIDETERRWDRDHSAYKSLRSQGIQPKGLDGVADLASRATTQFEIEHNRLYPNNRLNKAADQASQILGQEVKVG